MAGRSRTLATDEGLSLLEVVIAMLLFAVLALAILPLAMQAAKLSATNRDSASANSFASGQLQAIRALYPDIPTATTTCTAVASSAATGIADPAKTGLVADVTVDTCPSAYPSIVTVSVTVRDPRSSTPTAQLSRVATKILVATR
jgi:prepilin-type N-terminal cleavage/methylation domain-containing protein